MLSKIFAVLCFPARGTDHDVIQDFTTDRRGGSARVRSIGLFGRMTLVGGSDWWRSSSRSRVALVAIPPARGSDWSRILLIASRADRGSSLSRAGLITCPSVRGPAGLANPSNPTAPNRESVRFAISGIGAWVGSRVQPAGARRTGDQSGPRQGGSAISLTRDQEDPRPAGPAIGKNGDQRDSRSGG
jgi:hypothetical protein